MNNGAPTKVVLDTNILVASAYAPASSSRRIVEACLQGELVAVLSPALRREYEHIWKQAVRVRPDPFSFQTFLAKAEVVEPAATPRVVPEDAGDDKLVAAALAAAVDALITNDRHLLGLNPLGTVRIVRPGEFVRLWLT